MGREVSRDRCESLRWLSEGNSPLLIEGSWRVASSRFAGNVDGLAGLLDERDRGTSERLAPKII